VNNLRTLTPGTTLTDTLIQVRDLTVGTPLYAAVTGLQTTVSGQGTRLTSAEGAATALATRVTNAEGAATALTARVSAAENLNGIATTLTTTVLALRDLTGSSTLVTTLKGLRDNSGSSALVTALGNLRNRTDSGSALIRSLPCYGETDPSSWKTYSAATLYIDVSMAACGFTAPPQHVSASLFGTADLMSIGTSSVYSVTATSFRLFITPTDVGGVNVVSDPQTPAQAAANNWRINWIAAR